MKTNFFYLYFIFLTININSTTLYGQLTNIQIAKIDTFMASSSTDQSEYKKVDSLRYADSASKQAVLEYIQIKYPDTSNFLKRIRTAKLLSYLSINRLDTPRFGNFYGDPPSLRKAYFRAIMRRIDHGYIYLYISVLDLSEYSEPEKQELVRIFRREYPFNAAADYADYRMSPTNVRALRAYVDRTALNKKLDADSLFDLMYKEEWEEDRQKYENESTSPFLLKRIGELNITELIPEFEAKLRDSLGTYYCALALARMGNKTGIEYFLNSKEADLYDMIYTRNQDLIYAIALRDLENETLFDCDYFDENLTMPISFSTIEDLELWILNMPKILEDDPCRHPEIRTPDKIEACKKWLKENKGKYEFK